MAAVVLDGGAHALIVQEEVLQVLLGLLGTQSLLLLYETTKTTRSGGSEYILSLLDIWHTHPFTKFKNIQVFVSTDRKLRSE